MIQLKRSRLAKDVHANFFGKERVKLNAKLMKLKRDGRLDGAGENIWNSTIWKKAKEQLLTETRQKCAYCETPTSVIAYGDVEHFRPKSTYWWLAYCYDNYTISCTVCNQRFKSNRFDIRNEQARMKGPLIAPTMTDAQIEALAATLTVDPITESEGASYASFEAEMAAEWALLVHPYYEDPAEYFAYQPILESRQVFVISTKPEYTDVMEAAERIIGINRPESRDLRFQWYCLYMTIRRVLEFPGISADIRADNAARIADMINGSEAYTGMIRYLETQKLKDLPWRAGVRATLGLKRSSNI